VDRAADVIAGSFSPSEPRGIDSSCRLILPADKVRNSWWTMVADFCGAMSDPYDRMRPFRRIGEKNVIPYPRRIFEHKVTREFQVHDNFTCDRQNALSCVCLR
jgi:hypothetical protein